MRATLGGEITPSSAAARHLLPGGEGTIPTFSRWEKVAAGRMRAALGGEITPSSAAARHLLPGGEGTIPTFSHWEKVAEGRMRAAWVDAKRSPGCPLQNQITRRTPENAVKTNFASA